MKIKNVFICALSAVLLCSCANSAAENETSETAAAEVTAVEEIFTAEEAAAETAAFKDEEPEIVTEFLYDLDNDGSDEKIVLEPKSHIICYDKDGSKLGTASGQWCEQMDSIALKWYDDGSEIYPALYSEYEVDFAHDEYYIILSLKDDAFAAERLISWGYMRSNNGGWFGPPYVYDYFSDVYGDWVSEEKCSEYKAMVYDSIADAPSYKRVGILKKAAKRLMEDNILCDIEDAISVDIDNNGTDEYLLRSDGKLYCFEQVGDDAELIGEAAFDEANCVLEWYNDREQVFPVLRSADTYYRLILEENGFKAENFLQDINGKYYCGGKEISENDYLRKKYFIWDNKQNRLEYTVKAAADHSSIGTLFDVENDGIPELFVGYYGAYTDIDLGVVRLDGYSPKLMGGIFLASGSDLKKYYDSANDEYFFINTNVYNGTAGTSDNEVCKTVFYSNTIAEDVIASENYFFDRYTSERSEKIFLDSAYWGDERIDGDRFVDSTELMVFEKRLEEYLSGYELVDTLTIPQMMAENEAPYETYMKQAIEIEKRYLEDPSAARVRELEQVTIGKNTVNINAKSIDISAQTSPEEFEKLSGLKNLKSIYIYGLEAGDSFDYTLLSGVADQITDINLYSCDDADMLSMFPKLRSLSFYTDFENAADLSVLSELTGLESIHINGKIKNFDFVKGMTKLREIFFFGSSDEEDCFKAASELPSLRVIAFSGHIGGPSQEQLECLRMREDIIMPQIK